jgi:hypothetical protein
VILRRQKAVLWLAVMAIVLHGFWPLVGQLRAAGPAMVRVICTVHGTMLVPAEDLSDGPSVPQDGKPQPCAMCAAVSVAALVAALPTLRIAQAGAYWVSLPIRAPVYRPAIHSPARPRAPPAIS